MGSLEVPQEDGTFEGKKLRHRPRAHTALHTLPFAYFQAFSHLECWLCLRHLRGAANSNQLTPPTAAASVRTLLSLLPRQQNQSPVFTPFSSPQRAPRYHRHLRQEIQGEQGTVDIIHCSFTLHLPPHWEAHF